MSIVRIGMSEDKNFGDGYDAIFGKPDKKPAKAKKPGAKAAARAAKKPARKAGAKKK